MNCPNCNFIMNTFDCGVKICETCSFYIEFRSDKFYRLIFKSNYLYSNFLMTENIKIIYFDFEIENIEEAYKFLQKYLDNKIFE